MLRKRVSISRRRPVDEPEIIVIPMIDVMMFLLFFFMVASLAMAVSSGLPVNLPKASNASTNSAQNVTITVMRNNQIYLNTRPVHLSDLATGLEALHLTDQNLIIINADQNVTYGLVNSVISQVGAAGLTHLTLSTEKG